MFNGNVCELVGTDFQFPINRNMEALSKMFFKHLCRYIGIREQVYIRRKWIVFEDQIRNFFWLRQKRNLIEITGGSYAEGLRLPGSDIDVMAFLSDICVLQTQGEHLHQPDLIIETEKVKPGFVRLRVTDRSLCLQRYPHCITTTGNTSYLSNLLLFSDRFVRAAQLSDPNYVPHGPCATNKSVNNIDQDVVFCVACRMWPDKASEWIHRIRPNNWPPGALIQCIVNDGFLLVPIGNPNSEYRIIEWRISFSVAEKRLVYSMNHTQLLCYGLLKLYIKHVIESNEAVKGLLCSYFLKTCLFYCMEEIDVSWEKENFINCFWTCFKLLFTWVRHENCPNYFIRDNNMFQGKIFGDRRATLLGHLSNLYSDGIDTFVLIPCLRDVIFRFRGFLYPMVGSDLNFDISDTELEFWTDVEFLRTCASIESVDLWEMFVVDYIHVSSLLDLTFKITALDEYKLMVSQTLYHTYVHNSTSNKDRYYHLKMLQNYILHECRGGDICSGWLCYATLCYLTGKHNTAIHIVNHVLKKFKPYTIYKGFSRLAYNSGTYIQEICGRGLTTSQKMKIAMSRRYQLNSNFCFYPSEIALEVIHNSLEGLTYIPPIVYSNVLLFLSYKALRGTELVQHTLNELCIAAHSKHFVTDFERPIALALLDRCLQLANDWQDEIH